MSDNHMDSDMDSSWLTESGWVGEQSGKPGLDVDRSKYYDKNNEDCNDKYIETGVNALQSSRKPEDVIPGTDRSVLIHMEEGCKEIYEPSSGSRKRGREKKYESEGDKIDKSPITKHRCVITPTETSCIDNSVCSGDSQDFMGFSELSGNLSQEKHQQLREIKKSNHKNKEVSINDQEHTSLASEDTNISLEIISVEPNYEEEEEPCTYKSRSDIATCGSNTQNSERSVEEPIGAISRISTNTTGTKPKTNFNKTNMTKENSAIIIIEPVGSEEEKHRFIRGTVQLSRLIKNSIFGTCEISQVTANPTKNIAVITLKNVSDLKLQTMLQMDQIGGQRVTCRLPKTNASFAGVVGPFGEFTTAAEIEEELHMSGFPNCKAERLVRGKDKVASEHFKVLFEGGNVPKTVGIGYQRYRVRPFIEKPWQCFKCQGFRHNARECKGTQKCLLCSGHHWYKNCPNRDGKRCCTNCKGEHASTDSACPYMKKEYEIQKERTKENKSFAEAKRAVKLRENAIMSEQATQSTVAEEYDNNFPPINRRNNNNISSQDPNNIWVINKELNINEVRRKNNLPKFDKAIQCNLEIDKHAENEIQIHRNNPTENNEPGISVEKTPTIPKWAVFMIKILAIQNISKHNEKCLAITGALKQVLDIEATPDDIEECLKPETIRVGKQSNVTERVRTGDTKQKKKQNGR